MRNKSIITLPQLAPAEHLDVSLHDLANWLHLPYEHVRVQLLGHARGGRITRRALWFILLEGMGRADAVLERLEALDAWAEVRAEKEAAYRAARPARVTERQRAIRLRPAVIARDGLYCRYCGVAITGSPDIDHVFPIVDGGLSTLDNLVVACSSCNRLKAQRHPYEVGFTLKPPQGHGQGPQPTMDAWPVPEIAD